MAKIIEQINVSGTVYNIASTAYGVCSTAANEAAKVVPSSYLDGVVASSGITIHVKFANENTASNPTLTLAGGDLTLNAAVPITGITTWPAGIVLTLTYDGTNWVRDYDETIANNITGSGTSGSLVKFNGTNSITDGPALTTSYDSSTTVTTSHKFLREDGTWVVPKYTSNVDTKLRIYLSTTNVELPLVGLNSGNTTAAYASHTSGTKDVYGAIPSTSTNRATINPNTGAVTVPGGVIGNASTATAFSSSRTISLSGDISGSASATGASGWSITNTAIGTGKVTNDMLAGSIANGKLSNSKVTIAGLDVSLGGSIDAATLRTKLGLTLALRFVGSTSTTMSDGYTDIPAGISIYTGTGAVTPAVGDVVLDSSSNAEYVCVSVSGTTYTWEILGAESSWALSDDVVHISGAAGDILYWSNTNSPTHLTKGTNGQVLKLSNGLPTWGTDSDTKVTLNILATSVTDTYPLLVSAYKTTGTDATKTTATTVNRVAAIYVQPSTGTITATKFVGDGSGLTGVTASSVTWNNVTNKVFSNLYVNATSGGATSNAATDNDTTYIHLYDNSTKRDTIQLKGAKGASVAATNSKVITITSKEYQSSGSISAITKLYLMQNGDTTTAAEMTATASNAAVALGTVSNAVLYIKSIYKNASNASTGVSEKNS